MTQTETDGGIRLDLTSEWHFGRVDNDAAIAYALATNDSTTKCLDGTVAPLLFVTRLVGDSMDNALSTGVASGSIFGGRAQIHAQHDVHFYGPVTPGMELKWRANISSVRPTPAGPMVSMRLEVADMDGNTLAEHLWSTMYVGASMKAERNYGQSLPDHKFPENYRSNPIGERSFDIALDQTYRFGGVSGDLVGHAMDDEVARSEGFPRKILQGMCSFAMCSGAIVDLAAGGDPSRVRRLAGRFASPVHPRNKMLVTAFDIGRTSDGLRSIAYEVSSNGEAVVKHGRAEIAD